MSADFTNRLPGSAASLLAERLTRHIEKEFGSGKTDNKRARSAATWYLQGVSDVLEMLEMAVPQYWGVCVSSQRPVADCYLYGTKAIEAQKALALVLLDWHGGQDSGLYAVASCMLSCSDKGKLYRVHEHGGHERTDALGRALTELRDLRKLAKHPESVTLAAEQEAAELAAELDQFMACRALHLTPEFTMTDPPELLGRDRNTRRDPSIPTTHTASNV